MPQKCSIWQTLVDFIHEASEEELDDAIRSVGEDPDEIVRRGKAAIDRALAEHRTESDEDAS